MELEFALDGIVTDEDYTFEIFEINRNGAPGTLLVDWAPMIRQMLEEQKRHVATDIMSAKFHNTLVEMIVAVARRAAEERVALSGGCFQNKYLTERAIRRLRETGFRPYWHQRIPPNDGGIALGQAVAAVKRKT
jgi:hydrogenase maturation protein HypF